MTVWDIDSEDVLLNVENSSNSTFSVLWSPDGKHLACSHPLGIYLWDLGEKVTEEELEQLIPPNQLERLEDELGGLDELLGPLGVLLRVGRNIVSVCWSPDGRYIAGGGADGTITIWDSEKGIRRRTLYKSSPVLSVCWSPDGRYIAGGGADGTITIWDFESEMNIESLLDYVERGETVSYINLGDTIKSISWSPNGQYIAVAVGNIEILDVNSEERLKTYQSDRAINCVCWSPDGHYIAGGTSDNMLIIWTFETNPLKEEKIVKKLTAKRTEKIKEILQSFVKKEIKSSQS
ncbi:MAG: hypothetical protein QXR19_14930 [Candidatus Jordarchaeaceae archaeon]